MSDVFGLFIKAWVLSQAASMLMLWLGSRYASHRYLMHLGRIAHRKKLRALDRVWPLTKIRPLVASRDAAGCTAILSSMIALKSAASLAFGVIVVFWLPFASLIVPSIITVHDPNDPSLLPWVRKVAALQLTSHAVAAALGFAVVAAGPLAGKSLATTIGSNVILLVLVGVFSLGFAVAAGGAETSGLMQRGI